MIAFVRIGKGKPKWGAEPGKLYYVLDIVKTEEYTKAGEYLENGIKRIDRKNT